ncbi:MAG TPA: hypothetical protein VJB90_05265 [Candidatus Nanoarchaeia archaeon]|nr:hypothetical protein [Candidatus Nanoarchaeia archaeon]
MMRKGQAAMEFLMTYGWAILVVLVVIAALSYFGVLDPSNVVPDRCSFSAAFTCSDFLVQDTAGNDITFTLLNGAGKDIYVYSLNVSGQGLSSICSATIEGNSGILIPAGVEGQLNLSNCQFTASSLTKKNKYSILINYTQAGSTFVKTQSGELFTKRQP